MSRFSSAEIETMRAATRRRLTIREADDLAQLTVGGRSVASLTDNDLRAFIELHADDETYARHVNAARMTLAARSPSQ